MGNGGRGIFKFRRIHTKELPYVEHAARQIFRLFAHERAGVLADGHGRRDVRGGAGALCQEHQVRRRRGQDSRRLEADAGDAKPVTLEPANHGAPRLRRAQGNPDARRCAPCGPYRHDRRFSPRSEPDSDPSRQRHRPRGADRLEIRHQRHEGFRYRQLSRRRRRGDRRPRRARQSRRPLPGRLGVCDDRRALSRQGEFARSRRRADRHRRRRRANQAHGKGLAHVVL